MHKNGRRSWIGKTAGIGLFVCPTLPDILYECIIDSLYEFKIRR